MSSKTPYLKSLSIISGVLGLFILGIIHIFFRLPGSSAEIGNLINVKFQSDSIQIQEKLTSGVKELQFLNSSPFVFEIFHKDSVIFWNRPSSISVPYDYQQVVSWYIQDYQVKTGLSFEAFNSSEWALKKTIHIIPSPPDDKDYFRLNSVRLKAFQLPSTTLVILRSISWTFLFSALVLYVMGLWRLSHTGMTEKKKIFFLSVSVSLAFKILHYWPEWNILFEGFSGFKVINDASVLAPNLSHLWINIWLFIILVFRGQDLLSASHIPFMKGRIKAFLYGFFVLSAFVYFTHFTKGFVLHPDVNLDVDALMEFNHISFLLIVCFVFYIITLFHGSVAGDKMVKASGLAGLPFLLYTLGGVITGVALFVLLDFLQVPWILFLIFVVAFILMIDAFVESREKNITYIIWWLFIFSGFIATVLFYFGLQKEVEERQVFLEHYYSQPADSLSTGMIEIQDSLVASEFFNTLSQTEKGAILDYQDVKEYFSNLLPLKFRNWPLTIEMYDKRTGKSLFVQHFSDYYKSKSSFENGMNIGRGLVFNPFENKYFIRFEIALNSAPDNSWYFFIILNVGNKKFNHIPSQRYDFAVIKDNKIIFKKETYHPISDESLLKLSVETQVKSGYSMVVYHAAGDYDIISWRKVSGLIKPISLFSFIFAVSGLILLIMAILNTRYDFLPESISVKMGARSSLKAKIQWAVIGLILFAFFIIGVITVFYFKNMIEIQERTRYRQEVSSIYNNIRLLTRNIVDKDYAVSFLMDKLRDISYVHDKDVTLYDSEGQLVSSTSEYSNYIRMPFDNWWLVTHRPPGESIDILSSLEYLPIYVQEDRPAGFIAIDSRQNNFLAGKLTDFLSTILNAYIFLFLVAGALAITIANSITQPLSQLADKLKKFKIGKTNDRLEWFSNDEIGALINDYNNLTQELDKSINLLAKTERDSAWREMAKQVAHEIKNPLTPMKLSIQYLEKTYQDQPEKAEHLIPRISATLIEQINNLSQIAGEFSNFATMPQASNEKISLNEVVETIHDLFRKREDMDIKMNEPIDDLYVFADKNHLVRILNNLLKNAIQAIPDDKRGQIEIDLKRQGNEAIIRISDNGVGIPQDKKDKVFTPNFTTKSSGTGLGLAISANMIESFNGRIYFESEEGKGADFYVAIPLMKLDDYRESSERVSLD